jgi:hypothetical protein
MRILARRRDDIRLRFLGSNRTPVAAGPIVSRGTEVRIPYRIREGLPVTRAAIAKRVSGYRPGQFFAVKDPRCNIKPVRIHHCSLPA